MTPPISEALAELNRHFADQLPTRLDTIREQFNAIDPAQWLPTEVEKLHRLIHNLTGSAGTFGMRSLANTTRTLETELAALVSSGRVPSPAEWQQMGDHLRRMEQVAHIQLNSTLPSLQPPPMFTHTNSAPLIHLVEDDQTQAEALNQALLDDGYRVQVFNHPSQFRSSYAATPATERPAAVLMDMILPDGEDSGVQLITELGLGKQSGIPVVVISVRDDLAGRLAALRAGACRYLTKPIQTQHLTEILDALTGRQPAQPYRILLVDDDVLILQSHSRILEAAGMEVCSLSEPLRIIEVIDQFSPDVVVLDVYMPEATGPELAAVLRERKAQRLLPILFLSAETDITAQLMALNLGGDDFLVKPVQPGHLVAAVTARARRMRQNSSVQRRLETTLYEREREHLAVDQHAIVSSADKAGNITYIVFGRKCATY